MLHGDEQRRAVGREFRPAHLGAERHAEEHAARAAPLALGLEQPDPAGGAGARAVLEVRGRDVPFILDHGQPVARLVYAPMAGMVSAPYGVSGSNYQGQALKLAKHFKTPARLAET